jgi:hypothetical protein
VSPLAPDDPLGTSANAWASQHADAQPGSPHPARASPACAVSGQRTCHKQPRSFHTRPSAAGGEVGPKGKPKRPGHGGGGSGGGSGSSGSSGSAAPAGLRDAREEHDELEEEEEAFLVRLRRCGRAGSHCHAGAAPQRAPPANAPPPPPAP